MRGSKTEILSIEQAEESARKRLPKTMYEVLAAGAEKGNTNRANVAEFDRVTFRPRLGVCVSQRDLRTSVLGTEIDFPVLTAPIGRVRIVDPGGAPAIARAARNAGTISVVTSICGHRFDEVPATAKGGHLWLQISSWKDREDAEGLFDRARQAGYQALVVTLDTPVNPRPPQGRPVKIDFHNAKRFGPELLVRPRWAFRFWRDGFDLSLASMFHTPRGSSGTGPARPTWDDFSWVKEAWGGPVLVKGLTIDEDAKRAVQAGIDAIIISNHGGKSLDGAPATLSVLPEIATAVGSQCEILVDGGLRSGADVVKAIAMGARAVLVGRPLVWGLAANGEQGVGQVLEVFREGIDRTLGLIGCPSIAALDSTYVEYKPD